MTGQRVTPGGLAITAWARSHLRCQKTQRVKVVGYLKRHRGSELWGSTKLTGAGGVSVEGSTDRNHTWAESDVSLGGENISGSRDVWGTRLPDSKSHFQRGGGGGLTFGCLSISPSLTVKELSVPPSQLLATSFS